MIYEKQSLSPDGKFAKRGEDIKHGDIITIQSEGSKVKGKYGVQDIFKIKTSKGEFLININGTSINNLIDCFGKDSEGWIGKKVKVWLIQDFKEGKLIWKLYLTHPDQILGEPYKDEAAEGLNDLPTIDAYDEN